MAYAFRHTLASAALLCAAMAATATDVPRQDVKGLADPPGLKRYAGSVLVYRDDVAYDEVKWPTAKALQRDDKWQVPKALERSGQRSVAQYLTPEGRTALEVLRNYQQEMKGAGYETVYECEGEACGDARDIGPYGLSSLVMPKTWESKVGNNSPAACGAGSIVSDFRYAVLDNPATGAALAVMAWKPGILSAYCDEKAFQQRTSVFVAHVAPKAREQKMETISASEMGKSLDANGKVAIYGILFDTGKADIKPESRPSLEQIGALLKAQPALRLHVVGHTDNVGQLAANLDLSRRRADAVAAALGRDFGIARDRLTANGVASLAPVASNRDDAGRAKNRRVELVLQ
jgi:outer membrane protein OmpA-like peptidoglycan-associated protein